MSTVYLVCPLSTPDVDMKPIEAYGKLEIINSRFIYSDEIEDEFLPNAFQDKIYDAVNNFKPNDDYIVLGGDHVQFVLFAAALGAAYGRFKILRWDRQARGYAVARLELW